jgi:hypothetical protein
MTAELLGNGEPEPVRITVEQALAGQWVTPPVSCVDPTRRFCAFTGRPIARQYWQVMVEGKELAFGDRDLAVRHATYPRSDG